MPVTLLRDLILDHETELPIRAAAIVDTAQASGWRWRRQELGMRDRRGCIAGATMVIDELPGDPVMYVEPLLAHLDRPLVWLLGLEAGFDGCRLTRYNDPANAARHEDGWRLGQAIAAVIDARNGWS